MSLRWRSVPREALIWRELEGELVVRSARSGSTHLLGPVASSVLCTLIESDAGMTVADLVARLREHPHAQDEWFAALDAILADFQRLGLAAPERP